mmetsp:Transcript_6154/g.18220  ORF Transcript_6154/g.18220 Transcript_6154/m.18220 type:complete len:235 (+) Transcript_6154:1039-1743(+)
MSPNVVIVPVPTLVPPWTMLPPDPMSITRMSVSTFRSFPTMTTSSPSLGMICDPNPALTSELKPEAASRTKSPNVTILPSISEPRFPTKFPPTSKETESSRPRGNSVAVIVGYVATDPGPVPWLKQSPRLGGQVVLPFGAGQTHIPATVGVGWLVGASVGGRLDSSFTNMEFQMSSSSTTLSAVSATSSVLMRHTPSLANVVVGAMDGVPEGAAVGRRSGHTSGNGSGQLGSNS